MILRTVSKFIDRINFFNSVRFSILRIVLILGAIIFSAISLIVSDTLIRKMAVEERAKMEIWAYATQAIASKDHETTMINLTRIIENNNTIPVIVTTESGKIVAYNNIELPKENPTGYLYKKLKDFRNGYKPIVIDTYPEEYLYYSDSNILKQLLVFPYIQLIGFLVFLLVAVFAIISFKRDEQNRIWEGLSRETAHQLGTPISSLIAWNEYLKTINTESIVTDEITKDIDRLEVIADRFQKIGSVPKIVPEDIVKITESTINYLRPRISPKIKISFDVMNFDRCIIIPINSTLIGWVIENLIKNAVNAIKTEGDIFIILSENDKYVYIDVKDTGCGIPKGKFADVFRPGYTTRKRGWGLGLSLSRRIIEEYHNGRIYIKESVVNEGTTFRIVLNKMIIDN